MAKNALIEIGTEELPASYIEEASSSFSAIFKNFLETNLLHFSSIDYYYTPRRIALIIKGLQEKQKDRIIEIKGPPEKFAKIEGKWSEQTLGFAHSKGISIKNLSIKKSKKGSFVFGKKIRKGRKTKDIIKENLEELIKKIPFPKYMRWEKTGFNFARPIRWLVAIIGKEIIPVSIAGVKSSKFTRGHSFLSTRKKLEVTPENYIKTLEKEYVIVNQNKRKSFIERKIKKEASNLGGEAIVPNDLLLEVTNLVEYPRSITGKLSEDFLSLPPDVIITAMESHQRYFPVQKNNKLLPYFIAIINTIPNKKIIRGNERVLVSRLDDAKFYFEEDKKIGLKERFNKLDEITFQEGLGTMKDKVNRMLKLASELKKYVNFKNNVVREGIKLSKTDLTTLMIRDGKEFTHLEGKIGYYYAVDEGIPNDIARVIYEHYLPRFSGDKLPKTVEGAIVGVVDRLDSIVASFIRGFKPTGSKDPLGVKRLTNGLIEIALKFKFSIPLEDIINCAGKLFTKNFNSSEVAEFFKDRIVKVLETKGIPYDIVRAIVAVNISDLSFSLEKARILKEWKEKNIEEYKRLVIGQKRVANILKGFSKKGIPEVELFIEKTEKDLFAKTADLEKKVNAFLKEKNSRKILTNLLLLIPTIDKFFDDVLVMTEDKGTRENRLLLLRYVREQFLKYGDLSLIVIEGGG